MRKMIEYLPSFMQKSKIYRSIFDSIEIEMQEINVNIEDLNKQINIDTATWALDIYEKDLGIDTDLSKPLDDRRSVIKSRERGSGKVDAQLIKDIADSYVNGGAEIEFDGTIKVRFTSILGIPPNIEELKQVVEELKPAHLAIYYYYLYRTHLELGGKTHSTLEAYTHEDIREGDV